MENITFDSPIPSTYLSEETEEPWTVDRDLLAPSSPTATIDQMIDRAIEYFAKNPSATNDHLAKCEISSILKWLSPSDPTLPADEHDIRVCIYGQLDFIHERDALTLNSSQRVIKSLMDEDTAITGFLLEQDRHSFKHDEKLAHPIVLILKTGWMRNKLGIKTQEEADKILRQFSKFIFSQDRRSNSSTRPKKKQRTTQPE